MFQTVLKESDLPPSWIWPWLRTRMVVGPGFPRNFSAVPKWVRSVQPCSLFPIVYCSHSIFDSLLEESDRGYFSCALSTLWTTGTHFRLLSLWNNRCQKRHTPFNSDWKSVELRTGCTKVNNVFQSHMKYFHYYSLLLCQYLIIIKWIILPVHYYFLNN